MNETVKRIFKRAGFGFITGIAVCSLITILSGSENLVSGELVSKIGSMKGAQLLQALLSGLCGAVCMGGTVLYDVERLPLALSTLIHCLMCIVPYFLLSVFLHWVDGIGGAFILAGIQLAAFFAIWLILYFSYRRKIRELNEIQKMNLGGNAHNHQTDQNETEEQNK